MVEKDRKDDLDAPERKLARLLHIRYKLNPPVDVEGFVRRFVQVEIDTLPGDADAVVLHASRARSKPLIILRHDRPGFRRRFTLAHELGHLVIPWHAGTIACHPEWDGQFDDQSYSISEIEANRFASELLMPYSWLKQIVEREKNLTDQFASIKKAQVSSDAAALGLARALPPGRLLTLVDGNNVVVRGCASPGTRATPPQPRTELSAETFQQLATQHEVISEGSYRLHCWTFESRPALKLRDSRDAKEIWSDIMRSFEGLGEEKDRITRIINGIIGNANSQLVGCESDEMFGHLVQRCAGRPELTQAIRHEDFRLFLSRRAMELARPVPSSRSSTTKSRSLV